MKEGKMHRDVIHYAGIKIESKVFAITEEFSFTNVFIYFFMGM